MSPRRRFATGLVLGLILAATAGLRLSTWPGVFPPGGEVRLVSPDCQYHLLRVERAAAGEPLRVFDPDLDFPAGGIAIWPPLFDRGAALFARTVRALAPQVTVAAAAVFWPVLVALGLPIAAWALTRQLHPRGGWPLVAAAWTGGLPAFLIYSQLGHLDQHVAEAVLAATGLALVTAAVRPRYGVPRLPLLAGAGMICGLFVLTWQGGIFLAPLLFAGLFAAEATQRRRPGQEAVAALFAPATAITALGTAATLQGEPAVPFTYISVSWFQPAALALCWAVAALGCWQPQRRDRHLAWFLVAIAAGVFTLAFTGGELALRLRDGLAHLAQSDASGALERGGYVRYPNAWLATIGEYRPLWPFAILRAEGSRLFTGVGLLCLPLAWFALGLRALVWRHPPAAVVATVLPFHFALAVAQRRYAVYMALFVGVAVVVVVRAVLGRRLAHAGRWRLLAPLTALAPLALAAPFWPHLDRTVGQPGGDAARFLGEVASTVAQPPRDADGRAAWGLMGPWSYGHTLRYRTRLPIAADNFGYGFADHARVWLATSDEEARTILRRRRIRYVMTTRLEQILPLYARQLGLPPPTDQAFALRLHRGAVDPGWIRPVVDSASGDLAPDGSFVPRYRLFEITDSAAPPGTDGPPPGTG